MVDDRIRVLVSAISHLPLHYVFRDSGTPEKYGFKLELGLVGVEAPGRPAVGFRERVPALLRGDYEFLSGLHHETYVCRARGEKRLVYLAQTQNDWDDRLIARPEIKNPKDLEGKKILTVRTACVIGNLDHALGLAGVDTSQVEFIFSEGKSEGKRHQWVDMVARGEVDAANVDIPFDLQARKRGLNVVSLPSVPVIHNTTICTSTEFVWRNEEKGRAIWMWLMIPR